MAPWCLRFCLIQLRYQTINHCDVLLSQKFLSTIVSLRFPFASLWHYLLNQTFFLYKITKISYIHCTFIKLFKQFQVATWMFLLRSIRFQVAHKFNAEIHVPNNLLQYFKLQFPLYVYDSIFSLGVYNTSIPSAAIQWNCDSSILSPIPLTLPGWDGAQFPKQISWSWPCSAFGLGLGAGLPYAEGGTMGIVILTCYGGSRVLFCPVFGWVWVTHLSLPCPKGGYCF